MKQLLYYFGSMIFIGLLCFMMGKAYEHNKNSKYINILQDRDVSKYIIDSEYNYLEGGLLYIPNEISVVSWYDDKNIDLMFCFKDDAGNYHLGFTGKTVLRDSLHLDIMDTRDHSELQPVDTQIAIPIMYQSK